MNYKKLGMTAGVVLMAAALLMTGCSSKKNPAESTTSLEGTQNETPAPDVPSEITLGEYKGIAVTVEKLADITDADVEASLTSVVENSTVTNENKSRAVADGDTVNVSYTGYIDGVEIPDSSIEDYNMLIGSGIFFDGAEANLVGVMPGAAVDISVTFPDSYPKAELVGKSAVYKVTVNYIYEEGQGELTDEFIASISDCKTVDEFRQMTKEAMEQSRENERVLIRRNAVWEKVMENCKDVAYNASEVEAIAQEYRSYDESAAKDFEMTLEDYVKQYQNMTLEEYNASIEKLAKSEIKKHLVAEAIAQKESINSDNITEEEITRCSQEQGYEAVDGYKNDRGEDGIRQDVLFNRVLDFVVENAEITESNSETGSK